MFGQALELGRPPQMRADESPDGAVVLPPLVRRERVGVVQKVKARELLVWRERPSSPTRWYHFVLGCCSRVLLWESERRERCEGGARVGFCWELVSRARWRVRYI